MQWLRQLAVASWGGDHSTHKAGVYLLHWTLSLSICLSSYLNFPSCPATFKWQDICISVWEFDLALARSSLSDYTFRFCLTIPRQVVPALIYNIRSQGSWVQVPVWTQFPSPAQASGARHVCRGERLVTETGQNGKFPFERGPLEIGKPFW